jgi:hypothetical protein
MTYGNATKEDPPHWPGYHECSCCGEIICGGPLAESRCDCCVEAGCDEDGESGCDVPRCPICETPESFMNDGKWHHNCDDRAACEQAWEEARDD